MYLCNVNREALCSCSRIVSLQAHSWPFPAQHLGRKGSLSLLSQSSSHQENPSLFQVWKPRGKSTHLKALITELTVFTPGGMLGFHFTASRLWIEKPSKYQLGQNPKSSCYSSAFKMPRRQDLYGSTSLCNSKYYCCNTNFIIIIW